MFPGENGIKLNEEKIFFTSVVTKSSKHGFHGLKVQQKNYISTELLEILFLFCGANKTELFRKKYLLLHRNFICIVSLMNLLIILLRTISCSLNVCYDVTH